MQSGKEKAKVVKEELRAKTDLKASPITRRKDAFGHPIAVKMRDKKYEFSSSATELINTCRDSAKLVITPENHEILLDYFNARKKMDDKLGRLYQDLTFDDFILRLFHKRYKEVYLDGREVHPRDEAKTFAGHSHPRQKAKLGRDFLRMVGSESDAKDIYREYLTLEEMVLSPLVLPQATSIVIGTGNRSEESGWKIEPEFNSSCDIGVFSYPAASEFRNGLTAHFDPHFLVVRPSESKEEKRFINKALETAARRIYGPRFAFEETGSESKDRLVAVLAEGEKTPHFIHKEAYKTRTKNTLRQVLLAADKEMAAQGLGTTFQLKGLGLGAFSFTGKDAPKVIEELYMQALLEVLEENQGSLAHIQRINLINFPSTFPHDDKIYEAKQYFGSRKMVVTKMNMDPTDETKAANIGGTVFCGDSGSMAGNEANRGTHRFSSDDPSTQLSLLEPGILDPAFNPGLKDKTCIKIVTNNGFVSLHEYKAEEKAATTTTTVSSTSPPPPRTFEFINTGDKYKNKLHIKEKPDGLPKNNKRWWIGGSLLSTAGGIGGHFLALAVTSNPAGWFIALIIMGGVLVGAGVTLIAKAAKNKYDSYRSSRKTRVAPTLLSASSRNDRPGSSLSLSPQLGSMISATANATPTVGDGDSKLTRHIEEKKTIAASPSTKQMLSFSEIIRKLNNETPYKGMKITPDEKDCMKFRITGVKKKQWRTICNHVDTYALGYTNKFKEYAIKFTPPLPLSERFKEVSTDIGFDVKLSEPPPSFNPDEAIFFNSSFQIALHWIKDDYEHFSKNKPASP
jgi:hypothetical protein